MCDCDFLLTSEAFFTQITSHIAHRIFPERMLSLSASCTVLIDIVGALTARTELLYAHQMRNM
jgi:hypothetical protein